MRNTPCGEVARRFLEARRSRSYIPEVSTRRVEHEEFGGSRGQFQGNGTDNGRVLEMLIREKGRELPRKAGWRERDKEWVTNRREVETLVLRTQGERNAFVVT